MGYQHGSDTPCRAAGRDTKRERGSKVGVALLLVSNSILSGFPCSSPQYHHPSYSSRLLTLTPHSLVFHYASDAGKLSPASTKDLHISRAEEILNKEAGWKALTGTTDFAAIAGGTDKDDDAKRLAFDLFVDRVSGFVGSYFVSLRGRVDALVFAGGIGEKSARLRAAVVEQVACLGFGLDEQANAAEIKGVVQDVGRNGGAAGGPRVLVCQTDEQFEMARICAQDGELWGKD